MRLPTTGSRTGQITPIPRPAANPFREVRSCSWRSTEHNKARAGSNWRIGQRMTNLPQTLAPIRQEQRRNRHDDFGGLNQVWQYT